MVSNLVRLKGLEPSLCYEPAPQAGGSTNSPTVAYLERAKRLELSYSCLEGKGTAFIPHPRKIWRAQEFHPALGFTK